MEFLHWLTTPFRWFHQRVWKTPRGRVWIEVLILLLLFIGTATYDYPKTAGWPNQVLSKMSLFGKPITWRFPEDYRLGLDLKGGVRLVYDAKTENIPPDQIAAQLEGVRDVIERRVNAFGVAEPLVQVARSGDQWRVIVELAGIKDIASAIKQIGETPLLEFKEENSGPTNRALTTQQQKQLDEDNGKVKVEAEKVLAEALKPGADFKALYQKNSDKEGVISEDGDLGYVREDNVNYGELVKAAAKETVPPEHTMKTLVKTSKGYSILRVVEREEAKEVHARHLLICFEGKQGCDKPISKEDAKKKIDELAKTATPENFEELVKKNSTEPGADSAGGDLGWFARGRMVPAFERQVFPQAVKTISPVIETDFGYHIIYKIEERPLKLDGKNAIETHLKQIFKKVKTADDILPPPEPWKYTGLSGKQLKHTSVTFDQQGAPQVSLEFNDEGSKLFAELTKRNINKIIAIFLDGQSISEPRVNSEITGGSAVIQGGFTITEAKTLSQRLNAGALPVPITLSSQQVVGASLGDESIKKSLQAGLIGLIAVILFMIAYYRLPGVLASLALLLYTSLTLSIFKVWPITLTLAGIAGTILSIGMAVDANVLIFERLKEEMRVGKSVDNSIRDGFVRAWTSIRDSNISSLITCVILLNFTSSSVKGFAVTLALGILISLFSAITVTRTLLLWVVPWVKHHEWLFIRSKKTSV